MPQITIIKNNPANGFKNPKNKTDQEALKIRWIIKNQKAILTCFLSNPFCQIKYKATPIRVYSVTQTGPNSQLGGLKEGLFKNTYQLEMAGVVKSEPTAPAAWQMMIAKTNFVIFFILINVLFS